MFNLKILYRNWPLKAAALAIGLVLWVHVKTDQRYEHVISLPLSVSETSGRFVVANEIPDQVEITVTGSGKDFLFGTPRGRVELRPRITRREAVTVDITSQNVEGIDPDAGFELVGIKSPRSVVLDFDFLDTRELPVAPQVEIETEAGYTVVGRIAVEPPTVRIGGPRQYVREMDSVMTEAVSLRGVKEDVSLRVPVMVPRERNITPTPEAVKVKADVQVLLERRVREIPIKVSHVPRGVSVGVIPENLTIDVVGGSEVVSSLQPVDISAQIDYRLRFEHGLDDLPIDIQLPPDVRLVRSIPRTASLMIRQGRGR